MCADQTPRRPRVAITGASGFVGSKVADHLESRGFEVHRFGRRPAERIPEAVRARYRSWDVELGPLEAPPAVDAVVHCAGAVDDWGTYEPFHRANVVGTGHVLETWPDARFVHVSTASVYDPRADHSLVRESDADPADLTDTAHVRWLNAYGRTKRMAENLVTAAAAERSILLRPHAVYGPGDTQLLPRILDRIRLGRLVMAGSPDVRLSCTHIDNFSHAVERSIESDVTGPVNVSDLTAAPIDDVLRTILRTVGAPERISYVPARPAWAVAYALEAACGFGRLRQPPVTRFQLANLTRDFVYDLTRATEELGYRPQLDAPAAFTTVDVPTARIS
ncbi:MAG: hypothetical protein JWM25_1272 [Thermoleophilia bacterium]|nr:hypothetical protein [Thermoleophilia bacterium]MCZ4496689.1 hypothetical protein [Thermoleophilia bacterium]